MSINDRDFPLQFLVGRELAKRQNVDDSTATKFGLTGALVAPGVMGIVIARQLAIRDAPKPLPALTATGTGTGGGTGTPAPGSTASRVDRLTTDFKAWVEADRKRITDARTQAQAQLEQIQKQETERNQALRTLCESIGALGGGGSTSTGPPNPAGPSATASQREAGPEGKKESKGG